ncbi:hypothetical protein LOTGIDRAFT_157153 [Lottia gigantea]|uniref:Uncharacterized protein n=1 Tax=Lottia gigantea TaxID=225164 RepID=V4B8F3_LOTGI|nr:hypothetical protein LOTGIDRAFT_157153 [Lottia gigantea]ESP02022.1 hypothetical protein LOTGIDRAFT_157153 [Lottia gigantea]
MGMVYHMYMICISLNKYFFQRPSPEERASFLSKLVFHWINPLMFNGYKRALKEADLFELHSRDQSVNFVPYFYDMWIEELSNAMTYNKSPTFTTKRNLEVFIVFYTVNLGGL